MSDSDFYNASALEQLAINLFYGWGYNFYRTENQLRTDDQLVRGKVGWLLGRARASIDRAETAYRHAFLPAPTRAQPQADPATITGARTIERLAGEIGALAGQISAQPVPEQDRMSQRYREEAETLTRLIEIDKRLVGQAELLRSLLDQKDGSWIIENAVILEDGLAAIAETVSQRGAILI